MKTVTILAVVASTFLLGGCPYDFSEALCEYEEALKIDKHMIGKWRTGHDDGSFDDLIVNKGQKQVFHVIHRSFDEKGDKMEDTYYRAFAIEIGGTPVYTLERKDGYYNYFKTQWVDDNSFKVIGVNNEYVLNSGQSTGSTGKELRRFVEQHMGNDGFFDEPMTFFKEGSEGYKKAGK